MIQFHTDCFIVLKKIIIRVVWKVEFVHISVFVGHQPNKKIWMRAKSKSIHEFFFIYEQAGICAKATSHRSGGDRWVWILIGWKLQFAENVFIVFCNQRSINLNECRPPEDILLSSFTIHDLSVSWEYIWKSYVKRFTKNILVFW